MPVSGELIAGALAGLAFVGCSLSTGGAVKPEPGRRREVVVNGKRVKTVDIHAHCIVPEAAAVINHPLESPGFPKSDVFTVWQPEITARSLRAFQKLEFGRTKAAQPDRGYVIAKR